VIGAMKSATTTLARATVSAARHFMSRPKEPNFFSDDAAYAHGWGSYSSLFQAPSPGSSAVSRVRITPSFRRFRERSNGWAKPCRNQLIYLMRHPIDRLVSQYVHELTAGRIQLNLSGRSKQHPELIDYSRYAMQLEPFLAAYGSRACYQFSFPD